MIIGCFLIQLLTIENQQDWGKKRNILRFKATLKVLHGSWLSTNIWWPIRVFKRCTIHPYSSRDCKSTTHQSPKKFQLLAMHAFGSGFKCNPRQHACMNDNWFFPRNFTVSRYTALSAVSCSISLKALIF